MGIFVILVNELRRIVSEETGYGDASACLMLRIPVIRRSLAVHHQIACLTEPAGFAAKKAVAAIERPVR